MLVIPWFQIFEFSQTRFHIISHFIITFFLNRNKYNFPLQISRSKNLLIKIIHI